MDRSRIWLIGNGESLNRTPLDLLHKMGEITMATNEIERIYSRTEWRPTYYVRTDISGAQGWQQRTAFHVNEGEICLIRANLIPGLEGLIVPRWPPNIYSLWECGHHIGMDIDNPKRPDGWHLPMTCHFGTSLNTMAQLAALMGWVREVYFIGCDLGFEEPDPDVHDGDPNHFDPHYHTLCDTPLSRRDATLEYTHAMIDRELAAKGIKAYNATAGGFLSAHERRNIWEVLKHEEDHNLCPGDPVEGDDLTIKLTQRPNGFDQVGGELFYGEGQRGHIRDWIGRDV